MKFATTLTPHHRVLLGQIVRYAIAGLFVTACQAGIYWSLAALFDLHPQLANGIGYLAAVVIGYVTHNAFTFRGHGGEARHMTRSARFFAVSLVSYALNALWVFLCVTHMQWPEWSPIPAMIFVTPALIFFLNRQWVFR